MPSGAGFSLARSCPAGLGRVADGPTFDYPAHLELLNDVCMDLSTGSCDRAMFFLPPRHAKSTMGSRNFPAWYMATFPGKRVMLGSYQAQFAAKWGAAARQLLQDYGPDVFDVRVKQDQSARNDWSLTNGSSMVTTGAGGSLTGRGADMLVIDDPVKNEQEAFSELYRDRVWDWYQATARTRLEPGGCVLLIMTRWHEDDLAGRLLAQQPGRWRVVSLPALAEHDDPLGRTEGQALWPARYPEPVLREIRAEVGQYVWEALFQQRPSLPEGNIFKRQWWRYWQALPAFAEVIQAWDMTFKETADGSFVVGQVWGKAGPDRYLLDQVRGRWEFTEALEQVRNMTARWPEARIKLVEDKANGPAVMSVLRRELGGLLPVPAEGTKLARAIAVSPALEAGHIYLPDPAMPGYGWVRDFVAEWAAFPRGANDDQVDAAVHALRRWQGAGTISTGWVAR